MLFVNQDVYQKTGMRSKLYNYTLTNQANNYTLKIERSDKKIFSDRFFIEFIRFYLVGSGNFSVNSLHMYKFFNEKFKKQDFTKIQTNVAPIGGNEKGGAYVDVPIGIMYEPFELELTIDPTITKFYITYNGTFFEFSDDEIAEYRRAITPAP